MKSVTFTLLKEITYLLLALALFSCDRSIEVIPTDQVSDQTLWQNTENADLFLNDVYGSIPAPFNSPDPWENFSDNSINGIANRFSSAVYANSGYTPSNGPSQWDNYNGIRKCNVFIKSVTGSELPETWKKLRLGEARYLRAYYHMLLWTSHGSVPIIDEVLSLSEQGKGIYRPNNTFEETFKFITDECAAIAGDLPLTSQAGRVTKGAALALKGWCELFAASPLHNPTGDKEKWRIAAQTNKSIIELNLYKLFPDYGTLFLEGNNNNSEVIFDKVYLGGTTLGNRKTSLQAPSYVNGVARAFAGVNPTQELVDEYAMANGLTISDPKSGYDPQNPYLNREQRFYKDIVYDGSTWLGSEIVTRLGQGSKNEIDLNEKSEATNTGYYFRKGMDPLYAFIDNDLNSAHFIIFRYAEILLSYAEAQNEAVGPDESVYDAVNQVRARVKLPALTAGFTQAQMRVAILRERRVELCLEEKRWYDLIRLKIAENKLNGQLHGMAISTEKGKRVYKVVTTPGGERIFYANKNYVFPIPQAAMDTNPKLVQNPNY